MNEKLSLPKKKNYSRGMKEARSLSFFRLIKESRRGKMLKGMLFTVRALNYYARCEF